MVVRPKLSAGVALEPASAAEPDLLVAIAATARSAARNVGSTRGRTASTVAVGG
jgi:hypothetical protein